MYYNSNQRNNDYYSSYREELGENIHESEEGYTLAKLIKLGFIIFSLGILSATSVYVINNYSTEIRNTFSNIYQKKTSKLETDSTLPIEKIHENIPKIVLSKNELPQSIQLQNSELQSSRKIQENATDTFSTETIASSQNNSIKNEVINATQESNINPKDIALIVKIIMTQMNSTSNQSTEAIVTQSSLEEQLVAAESTSMEKHSLKETNHYNKVLIASSSSNVANELMRLRNDLNNVLEESDKNHKESDYSRAIKEEVAVRSNEMRIIIVQKGDTLSKIAKKAYGTQDAYQKIFQANPEVLKNPNEIFIGQKLRIPS